MQAKKLVVEEKQVVIHCNFLVFLPMERKIDEGNIIVLFNGFHKKTRKTPTSEIEKAITIKKEYYEYKRKQN